MKEKTGQAANNMPPPSLRPPAAAQPRPQAAPAPAPSSHVSNNGGGKLGRPPHTLKVYGDGHCMYRSVACFLNPDIARLTRNEFGIILNPDQVGFPPLFLRFSGGKCRNCPFFRAFY